MRTSTIEENINTSNFPTQIKETVSPDLPRESYFPGFLNQNIDNEYPKPTFSEELNGFETLCLKYVESQKLNAETSDPKILAETEKNSYSQIHTVLRRYQNYKTQPTNRDIRELNRLLTNDSTNGLQNFFNIREGNVIGTKLSEQTLSKILSETERLTIDQLNTNHPEFLRDDISKGKRYKDYKVESFKGAIANLKIESNNKKTEIRLERDSSRKGSFFEFPGKINRTLTVLGASAFLLAACSTSSEVKTAANNAENALENAKSSISVGIPATEQQIKNWVKETNDYKASMVVDKWFFLPTKPQQLDIHTIETQNNWGKEVKDAATGFEIPAGYNIVQSSDQQSYNFIDRNSNIVASFPKNITQDEFYGKAEIKNALAANGLEVKVMPDTQVPGELEQIPVPNYSTSIDVPKGAVLNYVDGRYILINPNTHDSIEVQFDKNGQAIYNLELEAFYNKFGTGFTNIETKKQTEVNLSNFSQLTQDQLKALESKGLRFYEAEKQVDGWSRGGKNQIHGPWNQALKLGYVLDDGSIQEFSGSIPENIQHDLLLIPNSNLVSMYNHRGVFPDGSVYPELQSFTSSITPNQTGIFIGGPTTLNNKGMLYDISNFEGVSVNPSTYVYRIRKDVAQKLVANASRVGLDVHSGNQIFTVASVKNSNNGEITTEIDNNTEAKKPVITGSYNSIVPDELVRIPKPNFPQTEQVKFNDNIAIVEVTDFDSSMKALEAKLNESGLGLNDVYIRKVPYSASSRTPKEQILSEIISTDPAISDKSKPTIIVYNSVNDDIPVTQEAKDVQIPVVSADSITNAYNVLSKDLKNLSTNIDVKDFNPTIVDEDITQEKLDQIKQRIIKSAEPLNKQVIFVLNKANQDVKEELFFKVANPSVASSINKALNSKGFDLKEFLIPTRPYSNAEKIELLAIGTLVILGITKLLSNRINRPVIVQPTPTYKAKAYVVSDPGVTTVPAQTTVSTTTTTPNSTIRNVKTTWWPWMSFNDWRNRNINKS